MKNAKLQKKKRIIWRIILVVAIILLIFRLILPVIIVKYTNKQLQSLNEYTGSLEKVLKTEKRNHTGGNCYSADDPETGIHCHVFGTHIFRTSNKKVEYILKCLKMKLR